MKHPNAEFIKAYIDGKDVEYSSDLQKLEWRKVRTLSTFDHDCLEFRIAPEKPWYRVALFKDCSRGLYVGVVEGPGSEDLANNSIILVRWLTDRVYY